MSVHSSSSSNELRAIVLARGAPALLKPRFRERDDAGLKLNLICRAMGGGEWEGWLAKLPSHLAPISPPPFFFSLLPLFAPKPHCQSQSEVGGADARFFPTNLVKDTKIRIVLSRQAGWSYRCNGIRGVDDTWIDG